MPRRKALEIPTSTNEFISLIEDRYGENIIEKNEDIPLREIKVIPTGSISLDISTGIGGIPRGKFTEIYGPESSAKTSLCLSIAKQAIGKGLKVLYVEPENTLDYKYIESIVGTLDPEKFVLAQPETAEQSLFICEAGVKSKEFQLIILDSVGALAPKKVIEADLEDSHVALLSRLLSAFLTRNAFSVRRDDIAFIFVNQIRDRIGVQFGGVESPGGHTLKHLLALRILLHRKDTIEMNLGGGKTEDIGINSRFVIKKNKLARPFRTFFFPLIFNKGIDYTLDLINFSEMLQILDKRGSYYVFEGQTLGQGVNKTAEVLENDKKLVDKLTDMCYNAVLKSHRDLPTDDENLEEKGGTDGEVTES